MRQGSEKSCDLLVICCRGSQEGSAACPQGVRIALRPSSPVEPALTCFNKPQEVYNCPHFCDWNCHSASVQCLLERASARDKTQEPPVLPWREGAVFPGRISASCSCD